MKRLNEGKLNKIFLENLKTVITYELKRKILVSLQKNHLSLTK